MGRRIEADLLVADSEVRDDADPAAAEASLTRGLAFYSGPSDHFYSSRLHLARGRLRRSAGDVDGAEQDFAQSIAEYELQRRGVSDEGLQVSYFEQSGSAFDDLIGLLATQPKRLETAFNYSERKRARALLDRIDGLLDEARERIRRGNLEPLTASEIRKKVPAGVALVHYTLLDDRLLAWVVQEGRISFTEAAVGAVEVERRVERLRAAIAEGEPLSDAAGSLFDLLIRPVLARLEPDDRLVFIPDKSLHRVPFAALLDRKTKRYLIQDRTIAVAPSATLFLWALERDRRLVLHQTPTVLAVGNPLFDPSLAPSLPPLPSAEAEARSLAGLFPGSELVLGKEATREAFLAAAGRHELIHFGGHAVVNEESPLLSYLLMSPSGQGDHGLLYAHELYGVRLASTRLVTLAGCRTADGPVGSEGVLSLARAFLAAGVPSVVASLWDIDDARAAGFFRRFYPYLLAGRDPSTALRSAQVAMLSNRSTAAPANWAAVEIIGAGDLSSRSNL